MLCGRPQRIVLDFKWVDGIEIGGESSSTPTDGDAAPNDRFNFRAAERVSRAFIAGTRDEEDRGTQRPRTSAARSGRLGGASILLQPFLDSPELPIYSD